MKSKDKETKTFEDLLYKKMQTLNCIYKTFKKEQTTAVNECEKNYL